MRPIRAVIFLLLALASVLPVIVFHGLLNPFSFGRALVARAIAAVLFLFLLYIWKKEPSSRPSGSLLIFAGAAYIVFTSANALLAADPLRSLISDLERSAGIIELWTLAVYFLAAVTLIKSGLDWKLVWKVQLLVGLAAVLLSLLYLYAGNYIVLPGGGSSQIWGPLANPAFLAEYSLLLAAMALMFFSTSFGRLRLVYGGLAAVFFLAIYLAQIRGVYAGLLVALLLAAVVHRRGLPAWFKGRARPRQILSTAAALLAVFLTISAIASNYGPLGRLPTRGLQDQSLQMRITVWRGALNSFTRRPFFGWGQENFLAAFYAEPPAGLWRYTQEVFDRSHNELIEQLVAGGLIGFALFAFLILALSWRLKEALRNPGGERNALIIAGYGLLAYGVSLLFLFETQSAAFLLVLLLAFVEAKAPEEQGLTRQLAGQTFRTAGFGSRLALTAAILGVVAFLWVGVIQPALAGSLAEEGSKNFWKDRELSYRYYSRALALNSALNREIAKDLALNLISEAGQGQGGSKRWTEETDLAAAALEREAGRHPWDSSALFILARLSELRSEYEPAWNALTGESLLQSIERNQTVLIGPERLALHYVKTWDSRRAEETLKEAISRSPDNPELWHYLALTRGLLGDRVGREAAYSQYLDKQKRRTELAHGDVQSAEEFYRQEIAAERDRLDKVPLGASAPRL